MPPLFQPLMQSTKYLCKFKENFRIFSAFTTIWFENLDVLVIVQANLQQSSNALEKV